MKIIIIMQFGACHSFYNIINVGRLVIRTDLSNKLYLTDLSKLKSQRVWWWKGSRNRSNCDSIIMKCVRKDFISAIHYRRGEWERRGNTKRPKIKGEIYIRINIDRGSTAVITLCWGVHVRQHWRSIIRLLVFRMILFTQYYNCI